MSTESTTPTPAPKPRAATAARPVDTMPFEREHLARLTPEERSAIYLNSIRKSMIFFVVVAVVGIVAAVIMGILVIGAIHSGQTATTSGF
jgi:hypothetical protein